MKHSLFSVITVLILFASQFVSAQTVSEATAQSRAEAFFATQAANAPGRGNSAPSASLTLAYTSQKDGKTCFYVYNRGENDGFVIIGGDEVAEQILAYSDHGHFDYATAPGNFKNMLNQYAEQISLAKPVANTQNAPSRVMRTAATPAVQKVDIPDLIQTTWNQWDPYNRAIPKLVNSNTGEEFAPPTGCVQTAVAQIMKYWNYPAQGIGQETRVLDYSQINAYSPGFTPYTPEFGTMVHNVDFTSTTYDWANMFNNYTGQETEEQINAVSTLMYHIGIACQAVFGVNETTGANPADGLKTYFGYSPKATELNRDEFDDQTWEELIYTELALNRPVLYAGVGDNYTGHQFIVHGYSSQYDMYKVNWGWGGSMDCYCKLTPVSGSGSVLMGYENNQEAVIRLQPATMDSNTSPNYGDTFWYNGLKYSIISNVFRTVEMARPENSNWYENGHITVPSTVSYQGNSYSVIGIGDYAFSKSTNIETNYNLLSIEEVNLPDGIRKIGSFAFSSCEFTHISMPNTVSYLGLGCFHMSQVEEIVLPNLITTIPTYCFEYCQNLRNISLPNNLIKIGSYAFEGCNNLIKIILPSTFTEIEHGVFRECSNLEIFICESTTPPTIRDLETPFSETVNTGVLLVPAASISQYQNETYWQDWKNIQPIETTDISMLGEEVTIGGIQYQLFPSGAQVNKVFESNSVITIPDEISVNNYVYPVVSIGNRAFDNVQCDTINLPQHLKTIKPNAFNAYVKHISLPDGVTSIAPYAFQGCNHLERISIPSTIEDIPDCCFNSCTNLHLVELSQNIKAISAAAFDGCKNLFTIICHATDVPEWEGSMMYFSNQVEGTLYVPNLSIQDYHTSEFGKNWRFIKPISTYDESDTLLVIERDRMSYRLLDHGAIFMGSRYNINEEHIVVPDTLVYNNESYNVISIGTGALSHTHSMSSISLPIALHSIMNNAFSGCDGLEEIHFPDSLKYIGGRAFWLSAIEKLVIPEGVVSIPIFFETSALKELVIPSTVSMEIIRFDANVEKAYLMNPDNFSRVIDSYQTSVYVPNEYVAQYQNESNWQVKEVLPITPLTSITLAESNLSLTTGEIDSVVVNYAPANASLQYVKWISSDPTIASVNADGVVTAHQAGTTTITATSMYYSELSDSCIVTVTPAMYQISFLNDDGTILQQDSVDYGQIPAYNGATPSKKGTAQYTYTFVGWSPEVVAVTGDATYTATYTSTINQYTITVSGENCATTGEGTYDYGTEVTLTVTPDEGYRFIEWSDGVPEAMRQIIVVEDATYTALVEKQSIETGWQENNQSEQVLKIFDGTNYYILRGGKRYTMQGQEVK